MMVMVVIEVQMVMMRIVKHNASRVISGENRARAVERLARHAQLVVVHDTQVELPIHLSMLCKI